MTAADNRQLIRHYFDLIAGRRQDRPLGDFFSPDVTWQVPQSNPHIKPNPRRGHAAVMDLLQQGVGVYAPGSMQLDVQRLLADEDGVVAQFTLAARLASGAPYRNDYCFVFTVRDGLICGVCEYLDTLSQAQQGTWDALDPQ